MAIANSPHATMAETAAKAFRDKRNGVVAPVTSPAPNKNMLASTMASKYPAPTAAPKVDYKSILDTVMGRLSGPQKSFSYNPQTDQTFQAAAGAVRSGVGTAQANTNARLRATGQGKSSYSETVANQIAQQAESRIANEIRPQYEQMAYGRFTNEQNNERQTLSDLLNVGRGYNDIEQQEIQNDIAESGLTGYYNPTGMSADQINQEIAQNSKTWFGASPEQRQQLHARNVELNALIGKTDATGNGDYVGGNPNGNVGIRTIAGQTADLNNQGQGLQNQLSQLKLDNYPTELKQQAKIFEQQYATGQIDQDTALFKLDQLRDPNSPVNRASQIEMELKELELQYAEPEMKARLEQIRKTTAQIGAAPYQSDLDRRLDQVRLDTATEELKQLKDPKESKQAAAQVEKMTKEKQGLAAAIRNGQVTGEQALKQIKEDEKLGIYSPEEAQEMTSALNILTGKGAPTFPGNQNSSNILDKYLWLNKK